MGEGGGAGVDVCMSRCCGFCPAGANYHIGFGARCKHNTCNTESNELTGTTTACLIHAGLLNSVGGVAVTSSACPPPPAAHLPGALGVRSTVLSTCKRNSSSRQPEPLSLPTVSPSPSMAGHTERRSDMPGDCMLAFDADPSHIAHSKRLCELQNVCVHDLKINKIKFESTLAGSD